MRERRVLSRRFRLGAFVAAAVGGGLVAFACGPGPIADLTNGQGRKDSGIDACPGRAVAPLPPPANTPDDNSLPALVFAAEDVRADNGKMEAELAPPKSLDLDRTCTGVEPPSCRPPANARPPAPQPEGRDNVMGPLLGDLATLLPVFEAGYLKRRIAYGLYTILFEVKDWNGGDNDPHVIVSFRISVGTHQRGDAGVTLPKFDGEDVWDIDPGSILNGQFHVGESCEDFICLGNIDTNAYVSGGVLVAHFDSIPLVLSTTNGDVQLPFKGAIMTAKLKKTEKGAYRMDGELAGRMPTAELLGATGAGIPDPTTQKSLCSSPVPYDLFKKAICGAADLAATPATDRTDAPCEALSEAVSFTGGQAKLGLIRGVTTQSSDCPGFTDSCGK